MKRLLPILFLAVMFVRHYESQGVPVPNAQVQYFGNTGAPLASGQLFSYISSVLALYAVAACQAKVAFPVFAAVNQGGDMLQRPAFPGPYLPATLAA